MKKIIFILTLISVFCTTNIYAARFGSGKSFGQRSNHQSSSSSNNNQHQRQDPKQTQPPHQQQANNAPTPPKRSFMSKMLPVLAGLSAGALLGSLLSGHGLGGGLGGILMVLLGAGLVFFLIRAFMRRKAEEKSFNNFQTATAQPYVSQGPFSQPNTTQSNESQPFMRQAENTPAGSDTFYQKPAESYQEPSGSYAFNRNVESFNREEFLRTAKITFIRMQNAYDHKDLTDIRNFTTPEVFAEIQIQLQERGNDANYTEVVHINASLLDEPQDSNPAASVMFSGQIKEQQNAPAVNVNEVWHFVKTNNNWLIAGIEQQK